MSKIYPFHMAHLFRAKGISWSPEAIVSLSGNASNPDFSIVSCFSENKMEAVFGIKRIQSDVGECFALLCDSCGPIALQKGAITVMEYWKSKQGFRRIQATVRVGFEKGSNWLLSLGFEKEGTLKGYDSHTGEDHVMYGRIL